MLNFSFKYNLKTKIKSCVSTDEYVLEPLLFTRRHQLKSCRMKKMLHHDCSFYTLNNTSKTIALNHTTVSLSKGVHFLYAAIWSVSADAPLCGNVKNVPADESPPRAQSTLRLSATSTQSTAAYLASSASGVFESGAAHESPECLRYRVVWRRGGELRHVLAHFTFRQLLPDDTDAEITALSHNDCGAAGCLGNQWEL